MTSPRRLPPTYPITTITTDDLNNRGLVPPNAMIVWVQLGTHAHPVPVFRYGPVQIYPRVQLHSEQGNAVDVVYRLQQFLVQDDRAGLLPIMGHDFNFAYAIAQDWTRALRTKEVDLADRSTVAQWAQAYNRRTPISTTLIQHLLDPPPDAPPNPGVPPLV